MPSSKRTFAPQWPFCGFFLALHFCHTCASKRRKRSQRYEPFGFLRRRLRPHHLHLQQRLQRACQQRECAQCRAVPFQRLLEMEMLLCQRREGAPQAQPRKRRRSRAFLFPTTLHTFLLSASTSMPDTQASSLLDSLLSVGTEAALLPSYTMRELYTARCHQ